MYSTLHYIFQRLSKCSNMITTCKFVVIIGIGYFILLSFRHSIDINYVFYIVHQMKVALGERGHKLSAAEDKTVGLVHTAQQLADIAHKVIQQFDSKIQKD